MFDDIIRLEGILDKYYLKGKDFVESRIISLKIFINQISGINTTFFVIIKNEGIFMGNKRLKLSFKKEKISYKYYLIICLLFIISYFVVFGFQRVFDLLTLIIFATCLCLALILSFVVLRICNNKKVEFDFSNKLVNYKIIRSKSASFKDLYIKILNYGNYKIYKFYEDKKIILSLNSNELNTDISFLEHSDELLSFMIKMEE